MKRVIKCFCMMALVALAFTSCKKEEQKSIIKVSSEQLVVESEDRAYIRPDLQIVFEVGDRCMLFNIDNEVPTHSHCCVYKSLEEGASVSYEDVGYGTIAEDILDAYYGFYPGGEGHTVSLLPQGENKAKFRVEPTQEYRLNKVSMGDMYMAAKVDDVEHLSEASFDFKNICGILQLKPYEAAQRTVQSIEVVDNTFHLSGWVELIIPEVDPIEMRALFNAYNPSNEDYLRRLNEYKNRIGYNVTDAGYSVVLDCMGEESPNGVQLGSSKSNTPVFNIVLRPLALSNGFHLIFTFTDGTTKDVDLSSLTAVTITPNVIKPVSINLDSF